MTTKRPNGLPFPDISHLTVALLRRRAFPTQVYHPMGKRKLQSLASDRIGDRPSSGRKTAACREGLDSGLAGDNQPRDATLYCAHRPGRTGSKPSPLQIPRRYHSSILTKSTLSAVGESSFGTLARGFRCDSARLRHVAITKRFLDEKQGLASRQPEIELDDSLDP